MHARDFQEGQTVPGTVYRVVRLIGAGGMGTVYDVEDTTIGKRYVLKTLHPQLGAREDLARRMQNEARTLARLNHPNIVEVITAGVTADDLRLPYYVMERLNGQSLRVVLAKKGQIELPHAFHIGIDLLDALDHAHDKGVIHRDVKPDNIFLHRTSAGVTITKLLDFGIVSMLDGGHGETAGRFLGTLRYAAPEQLRGERPTPKTDVYAAGLVLYEIVAGRGPFDDEGEPQRIGSAHLRKPPPLLSRFVDVPRELEALVMAALAKNPEERPRDAFSFAASLRNMKRLDRGIAAASELTEQRATAPAVLGPAAARPADVQHASPEGPYLIAPRGVGPAAGLPRTTLRGMPAPTVGASSSDATALQSTRSGVDRASPTRTAATDGLVRADSVSVTGALSDATTIRPGGATDLEAAAPIDAAQAPLAWPRERGVSRSEEPHVRSVGIVTPSRTAWGAVAAGVLAVAAAGTLGILSGAGRNPGGQANVARSSAASLTQIAPMETASPGPVEPSEAVSAVAVAPSAMTRSASVVAAGSPAAVLSDPPVLPAVEARTQAFAVRPQEREMAPAARPAETRDAAASKRPAPRLAAPKSSAFDRPGPGF
jgi:tRNA A-37 threonylcarbamoyl transferase component Bud32